jgi:hypothetical protein
VERAHLTELRLTDFKSFHDEVLPLGRLTVLIGGNAAGKSNALEGLYALAGLGRGLTLREALNGSPQVPGPVRGGADGCAPLGTGSFALGCSVQEGEDVYGLDIRVRTGRELSLQTEKVTWRDGSVEGKLLQRSGLAEGQDRLDAVRASLFEPPESATPELLRHYRASRTITAALPHIAPLDPDPQTMRGYVLRDEAFLLPDGSNLSAVVEAIRAENPAAFARLVEFANTMSDGRVTGLDVDETSTGDVQLLLDEPSGRVPARMASDGTLRFLAFAAALLDTFPRPGSLAPTQLILIEEIERGLYPAQAGTLLDLIRAETADRARSVLVTTHSPALLAALKPEEHDDVIVCSRDPESGASHLRRLTELPGYPELIAAGGLGKAVTGSGLRNAQHEPPKNAREFFDFLESL